MLQCAAYFRHKLTLCGSVSQTLPLLRALLERLLSRVEICTFVVLTGRFATFVGLFTNKVRSLNLKSPQFTAVARSAYTVVSILTRYTAAELCALPLVPDNGTLSAKRLDNGCLYSTSAIFSIFSTSSNSLLDIPTWSLNRRRVAAGAFQNDLPTATMRSRRCLAMCTPTLQPRHRPSSAAAKKSERWFSAPDFRATLCVVPPPNTVAWERLQSMRRECRAVGIYRWPPHCNIVYPFAPSRLVYSGATVPQLADIAAAMSALPPFEIRLRQLEVFVHERSVTLIMCPETRLLPSSPRDGDEAGWAGFRSEENMLSQTYAAVERVSPDSTAALRRAYIPHVSVARFCSSKIAQVWKARLEGELARRPICFAVQAAHVLVRRGIEPFQGVWEIPLLGADSAGEDTVDDRIALLRPSRLERYSHASLHEMFPKEFPITSEQQSRKGPVYIHGRPLTPLRRRHRPWYS